MADFNIEVGIAPDRKFKQEASPKVREVKFGDGYSQRTIMGINNIEESWSLKWANRSLPEANKILGFFEDKKGVESFDWYPESFDQVIYTTSASTEGNTLVSTASDTYFNKNMYINAKVTKVGTGLTTYISFIEPGTTLSTQNIILADSIVTAEAAEFIVLPYKKYICKKWSSTSELETVKSVTATFNLVYEP
jgi:phage-related protein